MNSRASLIRNSRHVILFNEVNLLRNFSRKKRKSNGEEKSKKIISVQLSFMSQPRRGGMGIVCGLRHVGVFVGVQSRLEVFEVVSSGLEFCFDESSAHEMSTEHHRKLCLHKVVTKLPNESPISNLQQINLEIPTLFS